MRKGFTLIELLVALAIITILAATLLIYVSNRVEDARISRMENEIATLRSAVTLLFNDTATVLNNWQRLVSPGTPALLNWRGPYIQKSAPAGTLWTGASPWKTDYRLHFLSNATSNNFFANGTTPNLYPFRNAVALEVVEITNQTPASSMLKIDQDLDDGVGNTGFIVEATSNTVPFLTSGSMAGLTSPTYSGTTNRSVYILLATF